VDSVFIKVNPNKDIFIPSAFTPNNDGKNDVFKPFMSIQLKLVSFSIYNRWGERIFTTREYNKGWDGKLNDQVQPADVYIWIIKVVDRHKKITEMKGTVALIR
jgi:gliding motility-associated-like protein